MGSLEDQFEEEVRRCARLMWDEASLQGSAEFHGRERDGVFETRDTINVIEATTSGRKAKIEEDAKKTARMLSALQANTIKHCKGWIITQQEPTIDQKKVLGKYNQRIQILSFDQFRSLLFDGGQYLKARAQYPFGSVKDIQNNTTFANDDAYVRMDFYSHTSEKTSTFDEILSKSDSQKKSFVLLGEYGSGKSITLREIFLEKQKKYNDGQVAQIPVYLNLRDHSGQYEPQEALERYARRTGYNDSASDLVRAWRAGFVDLILDGFDELASTGWGGSLRQVRQHRKVAMKLVRDFASQTPPRSQVIISGRHNFFDTDEEMRSALGINKSYEILATVPFNEEQTEEYLSKIGFTGTLPDWLPAKPLLIGYLVSRDFIQQSPGSDEPLSQSEGWNALLNMICLREAEQDYRLEESYVRQIVERLATLARTNEDGLGKIDISTIQDTFRQIVGFPPDENAQQFILRLPGLGPSNSDDSTRSFVDPIFADAARAGDIIRFIDDPYGFSVEAFSNLAASIGDLAKGMIADHIESSSKSKGKVETALDRACNEYAFGQIALDIIGSALKSTLPSIDISAEIREAVDEDMKLEGTHVKLGSLTLRHCLISHLLIDVDSNPNDIPRFENCVIGQLIVGSNNAATMERLVECDIGEKSAGLNTSAEILSSALPVQISLLLSILRKLFLQAGAGRQESAFYRGKIDPSSRRHIPPLLSLLAKHDIAKPVTIRGRDIWQPNRSQTSRIRRILAAPTQSGDPILREAKEI